MVIRTERLTKYYGPVAGIRELSLTVREGEIFGFLGPNGAGKTTTIRLLLDLISPSGGKAFLFGEDACQKNRPLWERVGYLPGEFPVYSKMTGRRLLDYLAAFRCRRPVLREQLMTRLALNGEVLNRKMKHLSHGNRQKIGIIHALEHDPDLAILDEPSQGLDPLMQEAFYQILKDLGRRGKTIFFSSHNLPEVEKVCKRVAIIRRGRLVTTGTIDTLKKSRARRIILTFDGSVDPASIRLSSARLHHCTGSRCVYLVESGIKALLREAAGLPVIDVVLPEPDLEDVFLSYYEDKSDDQD